MKNHLGIKAVMLISLGMFAFSGCADADDPKTEDAWGGEEIGYHLWTVDEAVGHMLVGDTFSIEQLSTGDQEIKLIPDETLRGRWGAINSKVELWIKNVGGQQFLCGFVNLQTDEHVPDEKFGHGSWHGFLIKVKNSNELIINWSAVPLKDEKPLPAKCNKLRDRFHGGRAHANG